MWFAEVYFNSIKVRLERTKSLFKFKAMINFNSIKVRLELSMMPKMSIRTWFQFHKGTIRTLPWGAAPYTADLFQFHKGTIRTEYNSPANQRARYFNSIKVRLEPSVFWQAVWFWEKFQFHKGTIRTERKCFNLYPSYISIP